MYKRLRVYGGGKEEGEESPTGTARQLVGEEISAPPKIDIESIELAAFIKGSTCFFYSHKRLDLLRSTCILDRIHRNRY
jgi:hypothetical protein